LVFYLTTEKKITQNHIKYAQKLHVYVFCTTMPKPFNFDIFLELGFSVTTHSDSWNRVIDEYSYLRDDTTLTLRKKEGSEFAMGVRSTKSGERENHVVDVDEALRWFQRTFPDVVL
jgi:hypothetical protein